MREVSSGSSYVATLDYSGLVLSFFCSFKNIYLILHSKGFDAFYSIHICESLVRKTEIKI